MTLVFRWVGVAFISLAYGWACTGDCASCHYKLDYQKDRRHAPMLECKTCHTPEKMAAIDMGSACGPDCFACHDAQKLQKKELEKYHGVIASCMECHKNLEQGGPQGRGKEVFKKALDKNIFMQDLKQNFFTHPLTP